MRKNRSQYASKKYPNLYKYPTSPCWVFRKYSKEKRKEFVWSTGEEKDEARAYRLGVAEFDRWLGIYLPSGRQLLIKDVARMVLASKLSSKGGERGANYRSAKNQIQNHILPAFGHLRPEQMTPMRWETYDRAERTRGKRTKLANTRKLLLDILNRCEEAGLIRKVPTLKNLDPPPAPPKFIPRATLWKILRRKECRFSKLLYYIMWRQGGRPTEVLQYEWEMIHWDEGTHGMLHIPARITKTNRDRVIPLNSRVARILRILQAKAESPFLFPSRYLPDEPQKNYRKAWDAACEALGLDYEPYNLRDTFITERLIEGFSSTFIAKYVDNSAQMIDRRYAVPERNIMERLAG